MRFANMKTVINQSSEVAGKPACASKLGSAVYGPENVFSQKMLPFFTETVVPSGRLALAFVIYVLRILDMTPVKVIQKNLYSINTILQGRYRRVKQRSKWARLTTALAQTPLPISSPTLEPPPKHINTLSESLLIWLVAAHFRTHKTHQNQLLGAQEQVPKAWTKLRMHSFDSPLWSWESWVAPVSTTQSNKDDMLRRLLAHHRSTSK